MTEIRKNTMDSIRGSYGSSRGCFFEGTEKGGCRTKNETPYDDIHHYDIDEYSAVGSQSHFSRR
jgi:hypothetical protein